MGTVVHRNVRGQQPEKIVTSGDPRRPPEPAAEPAGVPPSPPVKKRLDKTVRRRATTMQRRHYPHGFGLFSCGNCRYFHKQFRDLTGPGGCQAAKVGRTNRPCSINSHGFGYFEPVNVPGVVSEIKLTHLSRDQLLLLEYRIRAQEVATFHVNMQPFTIGARVKVLINEQYQTGTVVRVLKRTIRVEMDGLNKIMSFRPDDLEHPGDPLG